MVQYSKNVIVTRYSDRRLIKKTGRYNGQDVGITTKMKYVGPKEKAYNNLISCQAGWRVAVYRTHTCTQNI